MHFLAGEVIDQTAVIEVDRDPSCQGKLIVQFKDVVQRFRDFREGQPAEALYG